MIPIIVIAGPTAVGKTALALWLARQLDTEIISADSMQVYCWMDIGTAKPSQGEQQQVRHHLIDLVNPDQPFSVADYQCLFNETVDNLVAQGKVPLVVGGTGLYIRACTQSFSLDNPAEANPEIRARLTGLAQSEGTTALHQQLIDVDPDAAAAIHPNDLRRIIRALEVFLTTGIPISQIQKKDDSRFETIYILLNRERPELYHRIEVRVDEMLATGLVAEVKALRDAGYTRDLKPMQSLGYKQINDFLDQHCSFDQAVADIKQKTRNYAKRQLTWFNREPLDLKINLSGKTEEFYPEILRFIEGRLSQTSNRIL
ncbi:MAG TPA: tRNA (adenosine(37)-N6)-dimethylallyltransferase MiaA [Bacillota bacterium]|nr:tRNA (adenosine(37)-N6)-dimethylallyltransferase MiaA [Bacillota bacterium]